MSGSQFRSILNLFDYLKRNHDLSSVFRSWALPIDNAIFHTGQDPGSFLTAVSKFLYKFARDYSGKVGPPRLLWHHGPRPRPHNPPHNCWTLYIDPLLLHIPDMAENSLKMIVKPGSFVLDPKQYSDCVAQVLSSLPQSIKRIYSVGYPRKAISTSWFRECSDKLFHPLICKWLSFHCGLARCSAWKLKSGI